MYLIEILVITVVILQYVEAVTVSVEQGTLRGETLWTVTGDTLYNSFKGIPYAAPPVGDLRFKAPQPARPWDGIRNASAHGNICPQVNKLKNTYIPGDEDCLFLNVYSPNINSSSRIPVMFFIHGGSYEYGSGNDDNYGPDFLMDKNIVLVTINYRLDALGFLCLDSEELPGNIGLKDQVAALRWVNRNIENFGGDPNNVTVFGQSAGGDASTLHALSPMSKGLFRRVIAMSGVAISDFAVEFEPKRRALLFGKLLGFETKNTTALLSFLRNLPVERLLNSTASIIAAEQYIDLFAKTYFVPVVEKDFGQERFLTELPDVSVKNGRTNDVDILLGYTTAEAIFVIDHVERFSIISNYDRYQEVFVPRNIYQKSTPETNLKLSDFIKENYFGSEPLSLNSMKEFVSYATDILNYAVVRYADHLSNFIENSKTYLYQFSCISERNVASQVGIKYGIIGVSHTDDLMYIFNAKQYNLTVNKNSTSYKMIQQMTSLITNFAKFGNPTPDLSLGVNWSQYEKDSQFYLDIGEELILYTKPRASMMTFWKSIFHRAGLPF